MNNSPSDETVDGKRCIYLLGPKFSLIDKIKKNKKYNKFTVVVNFGGSKKNIYVRNILSSISKLNEKINYVFIISPFVNLNLKTKNIKIINDSYDLQSIYSKCHLFLGAAGTSVTVSSQKSQVFFYYF